MSKKQHMSRLAAPSTWPIKRKGIKWVVKPSPGAHKIENGLPLSIILRDMLGLAKTSREVKRILSNKDVIINGRVKKDKNFGAGLLDCISIPKVSKYYRVILNKHKKISLLPLTSKEANVVPLKIRNKTKLKGGKTQVNFTNGWNLIVDKNLYKTNDVLIFDFSNNKIIEHLKLEKGNTVYFLSGKHASKVATLKEIKETGVLRKEKIAVVSDGKEEWETLIKNLMVIGKTKPIIKVE